MIGASPFVSYRAVCVKPFPRTSGKLYRDIRCGLNDLRRWESAAQHNCSSATIMPSCYARAILRLLLSCHISLPVGLFDTRYIIPYAPKQSEQPGLLQQLLRVVNAVIVFFCSAYFPSMLQYK